MKSTSKAKEREKSGYCVMVKESVSPPNKIFFRGEYSHGI
jgi:hypothetical protein